VRKKGVTRNGKDGKRATQRKGRKSEGRTRQSEGTYFTKICIALLAVAEDSLQEAAPD
jgi:hypothetical protein